ncbi:WD repeat-containing protein DWA2-like [Miscanthus floridulus]|uniref:WD repeat-containing protein DWA2-like n=1 Tax=Miscanthus floridulus TaxID=154761 RepID=UPI00345B36BF
MYMKQHKESLDCPAHCRRAAWALFAISGRFHEVEASLPRSWSTHLAEVLRLKECGRPKAAACSARSLPSRSERSVASPRGSEARARMQGGSSGIVYGGLKYQARCIADVRADAGSATFLAGTLSLKEENEVHLIRLSPAESELVCDGLFYHPNEIWDLKSCPFDHRVFSTVYTSGEGYGASVWKIPEVNGQSNSPQLEQLFELSGHTGKTRR